MAKCGLGGFVGVRTIIVSAEEPIGCPKCGHGFALSEGISRQAIERHAEDYERALGAEKKRLEAALAAEAKAQFDIQLRALREEIASKESVVEKFRTEELALRRQLRELADKSKNQDLEYQRRLDEELKRIEAKARASIGDEFARREAQLKAQIESAQREAADLKRKLEQGSQQTQGEALEVSVEAMLKSAFPMDEVLPVPKGVNGADLLQRVRSPSGQICGTIVWEAKQTRNWSGAWIPKLKDDQQRVGAELAVLISSAMPRDPQGRGGEPFCREGDVWVARFEAARPLAEALRATLLEMHKLRLANAGRSEKMELVYNYICSPQFAQRVRSIVEGFDSMKRDLDAEKAAMTRIWAKREKQLQRMETGMLNVVGDLQGIGQGAVGQLGSIAVLPSDEEVEL